MRAPESDAALEALAAQVGAGERRAIGKAITLVESTRLDHEAKARRLLELLLPRTGRATRLGISGVPGVGKSTFIDAFGMHLVKAGHKVAALAVDPSSSLSGGSILADKTRMPNLAAERAAFVRPSPSGGSLGGVARRTREAMLVCEAAGYDVVLVETVGVGQSEYAVASMVDVFLLLALAGAGDELQGIKRGIMELVDVVAITKADGDNRARAERAASEYTAALRLIRPADSVPPVTTVSAIENRGMAEVWELVSAHQSRLERSAELARKRAAQRQAWLFDMVRAGLEARFLARADVRALLPELELGVEQGQLTPTEGAERLLALIEGDGDRD
jgi:GTPase